MYIYIFRGMYVCIYAPFGGSTANPNFKNERRKIDFGGYHHPNCFAILVPEIGLFSKICIRS